MRLEKRRFVLLNTSNAGVHYIRIMKCAHQVQLAVHMLRKGLVALLVTYVLHLVWATVHRSEENCLEVLQTFCMIRTEEALASEVAFHIFFKQNEPPRHAALQQS